MSSKIIRYRESKDEKRRLVRIRVRKSAGSSCAAPMLGRRPEKPLYTHTHLGEFRHFPNRSDREFH